jgi:hypothetical protein
MMMPNNVSNSINFSFISINKFIDDDDDDNDDDDDDDDDEDDEENKNNISTIATVNENDNTIQQSNNKEEDAINVQHYNCYLCKKEKQLEKKKREEEEEEAAAAAATAFSLWRRFIQSLLIFSKGFLRCIRIIFTFTRRFVGQCRRQLKLFVDGKFFQRLILGSILINTLCMGIEHHDQDPTLTLVVEYSNIFFTLLFLVEMILKILAYGPFGYLKNAFNLFDGIIVLLSCSEVVRYFTTITADQSGGDVTNTDEVAAAAAAAISSSSGVSVLRTFRLLRILKLVRFMPALRRQLMIMLKTMDNVATFFSLLLLFIFIFSILGMHLFGCKFYEIKNGEKVHFRKNFNTLLWSTITVFQVLTQEDWNEVLYVGMEKTTSWAALYFVALMTFGNYVLFNLLVAILVEGFSTEDDTPKIAIEDRIRIDAINAIKREDEEREQREQQQQQAQTTAMSLMPNSIVSNSDNNSSCNSRKKRPTTTTAVNKRSKNNKKRSISEYSKSKSLTSNDLDWDDFNKQQQQQQQNKTINNNKRSSINSPTKSKNVSFNKTNHHSNNSIKRINSLDNDNDVNFVICHPNVPLIIKTCATPTHSLSCSDSLALRLTKTSVQMKEEDDPTTKKRRISSSVSFDSSISAIDDNSICLYNSSIGSVSSIYKNSSKINKDIDDTKSTSTITNNSNNLNNSINKSETTINNNNNDDSNLNRISVKIDAQTEVASVSVEKTSNFKYF